MSPLCRSTFITADNEAFSYLEKPLPAASSSVLLIHANGFNAGTYRVLLQKFDVALGGGFRLLAMDLRGHGMTRAACDPGTLTGWEQYREPLLEFVDAQVGDFLVVGHSLGGTLGLGLAALRPERIKGLLLVEPVLVNPELVARYREGGELSSPIAEAAAKRRRHFPSLEAAVDNYTGKGAFASWPRQWIRDYLEGGTVPAGDGGIELSCAPAWEARSFRVPATDTWQLLPEVRCPMRALYGEIGSTFWPEARAAIADHPVAPAMRSLPEASHFLPMEYPDVVVQELLALVDSYRAG